MGGAASGLARAALGLWVVASLAAGSAQAGDWPYYRHDAFGTSNAGEPLTATQAQGLRTLWTNNSHGIISNPVVANGTVYVTSADGSLHAVDASTGITRWTQRSTVQGPFHCFPDSTSSTTKGPIGAPAVIGDTVYMPGGAGVIYAYAASTGAIRWQTRIANVPNLGEFLWSSVFPVGDRIYVGVASLHDCLLVPGRVVALDTTTGSVVGTWWGDANHGPGGGVWTQPAYDARTNRLFLTTGTIAEGLTPAQQPLADAFVAVDATTMQTVDHFTPISAGYWDDFDFGASPVLYDTPDGRHWIAATNKNGFVYALNRDNLTGGVLWTYQISGAGVSPDLGESSISSPVYANGTLFVAGGRTTDGFGGAVAALDPATGRARWVFHPPNGGFILAALTAVGDVLLVPATKQVTQSGSALYVVEQSTGQVLYTLPTPGAIFAPPTYANGVLYVGDLNATLWALVPPGDSGGGGGGGGGGGTSTFTDDFNRTSGLGSNWMIAHGAFSTDGTYALGTASSSYAVWIGNPAADVTVSASLVSPTTATYAGIIARAQPSSPDAAHYAAFVMPDGTIGLARRTAWNYTYLATANKLGSGRHVLGLTVTGSSPVTLSVTVDGTEMIHTTDTSSAALTTAGKAGIFDYNGARDPLDNFSVGPAGTGGGGGGGGGSGGSVLFSDSFSRSGPLGSDWTVAHGSFSTNGSAATGTAPQSYAFWSGMPGADVIVSATIAPPSVSTYVGVIARASTSSPDADHYAAFYYPDGTIGVARRTAWNYTHFAAAPRPAPGAHVLALRVSGASPVTLSVMLDGTEILHVTDSSAQALTVAGRAGIFDYNGLAWPLDDFTASTPATAATTRTVAADDFSQSGPLGSGWQVWQGSFNVSSGAAHPTATQSYATLGNVVGDYVNVSAIVDTDASTHSGVIARASNGALNHYAAWLDADGSVHIARVNNGRSTLLAEAQPNLPGPHKLKLEVQGTSPVHLSLYLDDNPVIDLLDGAPDALREPGAPGLFCSGGAGAIFQQFRANQP